MAHSYTKTHTYFQIADADHPMYHTTNFETEEAAREAIRTEYAERNTGNESDEYWRNRKQVVLRVTEIIQNLDERTA